MASRIAPLSGFPEWSPHERRIEQYFLDTIRHVFELYGYVSIDPRAVEPVEQLLHAGETSKEVYLLRRLHEDTSEKTEDAALQAMPRIAPGTLGLHFDMTVPFARYVAERAGTLNFPFRRYQIQKAWRGERPQEGRYREFMQADADIVARGNLPLQAEVETVVVAAHALRSLPLPPTMVRVNNRKVAEGFYRGLGIADPAMVLRIVDKRDKVGPEVVQLMLTEQGLTDQQAKACVQLADISCPDASFVEQVRALGVTSAMLEEGLTELAQLIEAAARAVPGYVSVDLSIARGLDYYTGMVFETTMQGFESLGSVCSGGRYDDLVEAGNDRYPGVGLSIGVTRILGPLFARGLLQIDHPTPTKVLVAVVDDHSRDRSEAIATALRERGIPTEVSPEASKYGKQIKYADRRCIPYVWFPDSPTSATGEVRDLASGEQTAADPHTWPVPPGDQVRFVG